MPRPFELDPYFKALTVLPGIGPKNAKLFEKLIGGGKVLDLLWHLPVDFVDRRFTPKLQDAPSGKIATITLTIDRHMPAARRGLPYKVRGYDGSGHIDLIFFNAKRDWLEKQLPPGETLIVSGKVEAYQGALQMVHPDSIGKESERAEIETIEPVYPLTQGMTNKTLRKALNGALEFVLPLPEWIETTHKSKNKWPDWDTAIDTVHFSPSPLSSTLPSEGGGKAASAVRGAGGTLSPLHPARERLAYDECLSNQLALALMRLKQRKQNGRAYPISTTSRSKVLNALPFELTGAQKRSLEDIDKDMSSPLRMLRLLQGDVGSGKTVVAVMAMLNAIDSGCQAAIMAPTEILARQHLDSVRPWLDAAGITCTVLTGRNKGKEREEILHRISSGEAQVVIGTHALFQDGVDFANLGLAVIDEQHKFGVHQRLSLSSKSRGTDVLVMTATPIPRTLALTAYGDMEVSKLDEKPPGRKPIDTRLISQEKIEEMVHALKGQIAKGARIYWVCPLVEESEKLDLEAAEERYDKLKVHFGQRIGLVHGRMKGEDKDTVMEKFANGDIDILVSTTVIEVGVNVPEATIMVIEQAERFGLTQLHQLRGRVGRGAAKSFCFLVYKGPLGKTAKERLKTMRETEDGFVIAEKDLELRGGGEILGTRQSGMPEFKLADVTAHSDLLAAARQDAQMILERDPDLESKRGQALRTLLYLFEQDKAITTLRAG